MAQQPRTDSVASVTVSGVRFSDNSSEAVVTFLIAGLGTDVIYLEKKVSFSNRNVPGSIGVACDELENIFQNLTRSLEAEKKKWDKS